MKAAIIDDLAVCREELAHCLGRYCQAHYVGETPRVDEFASAEAFLAQFSPEAYDIIFLDQYMAGLSGVDTAREIRELDQLVALVFVTTSREHAVESFSVRACGYLVKPYTYADFEQTMELAGLEKIRNARFIQVGKEKILLREILWCNQDDHYIQIHTQRRGVLRFRVSFGEFMELTVPYPQFLTCYKGCIVNMEQVEQIDGLDFIMVTGEKIPFSKRDSKQFETAYHAYLFQREREDERL